MASFQELERDWLMLCQDCTKCWTNDDLQLAAELGKTLLERNKELESSLKQHQNLIEDQTQEIEYLTKQTAALREVSDSRLRIYEQLEVSIQDLERANHRLTLDSSSGKKHVKTLTTTIEALEGKCEELQSTIDELRLQLDTSNKRCKRSVETPPPASAPQVVILRHLGKSENEARDEPETPAKTPKVVETKEVQVPQAESRNEGESLEQIAQLLAQLRETKTQTSKDQRRIAELEEQLATVAQQNQALENQVIDLHHRDEDMKSIYDELSTLEEVRKGQMCSRCLRTVDSADELPDDDDSSMLEKLMTSSPHFRSSFSLNVQEYFNTPPAPKDSGNLYKDLVEKYEALLEVHRRPSRVQKREISLQEELQMSGDFKVKDTDEESGHGDSLKPHQKACPTFSHTPTDFSEAETSSSGFSDETSNKATQTEERPGSLLCAINDGDDCRVSIYDDASPISSRFRNRPEYHELFKEIFTVLKTPTEVKLERPKTPVVSCRGILDDDTQSVVSSMSEISVSQADSTTIIESIIEAQNQPIPEAESDAHEQVLKPLVRQPLLEYISVEVRKRSASRRKNKYSDRADRSPVTHIIGSPKINYSSRPNSGKKKRELRSTPQEPESAWNGNTMQFWASSRNVASPTPSQGSGKFEFKPSVASQELHKLKKLDLSYAEVVRKADNKKQVRQRRK